MSGSRTYLTVTASYWAFTLSDGALRMLVLLHFFALGYTPFQLAFLFVFYELAGIFATLGGGWLAVRFGITRMLATGIILQICGLLFLSALSPDWTEMASVMWVLIAQGIAGIAKDFTKTASKTAIKLTSVSGNIQLFSWVAWFTGSKNAMKGIGFFAGGLMLDAFGLTVSLYGMAGMLVILLGAVLYCLPTELGKLPASQNMSELFSKSASINFLAAARVFLFGARDIWFVVGVPVFLYQAGWSFWQVGGFLAIWTIFYGMIQAIAPRFISRSEDGLSREIPAARIMMAALCAVPLGVVIAYYVVDELFQLPVILAGLGLFAFFFALNSSLHSYLILAYAGTKKAAEDVGFYYAANAAGRLAGTLLSGLCFQNSGIISCLIVSFISLALCFGFCLLLPLKTTRA